MYGQTPVNWTVDAIETLKTKWAAGWSHSQIAPLIPNATRSAIAGKIMRLKLPPRDKGRPSPHSDILLPSPSPRPKPGKFASVSQVPTISRRNPNNSLAAKLAIAEAEPGLPERLIEPATGSGLKLIELENHNCRWPFGDPLTEQFYFCGETGANFKDKIPYCRFHAHKSADRTSLRNPRAFERSAARASY